TAEQLASEPPAAETGAAGSLQSYEVFQKLTQRQSEVFVSHLGQVMAMSAEGALRQAMAAFADAPGFVWWLVRSRAITASGAADGPSWFEPARDKSYKQPGDYPVLSQMRAVRSAGSPGAPAEGA
ncbi:MAG: hypothetical protein ABI847_19250, partial [Anaerolineales bacterium]